MLHLALALAAACLPPADEAFRALTFEQAQAAAVQEKKLVLIDFFTTWCVPCKKLDSTTWKDEAVQQWLGKQCVAIKLDAEKNAELAKRFHVEAYPTVVLLKADGTVIDSLVGYKDAQEFLACANDALAGKNALTRAKQKLAGHEQDPMERQSYADELARAGKYEEALAEYLWCFDNGNKSRGYGGVRRSFLLSAIDQLGGRYPPAIKALEERRDAAEAKIRAGGSGEYDVLADALALNEHLKSAARSLLLFDDVRKAGPIPNEARFSFYLLLREQLRESKRYADLLGLIDDPVGQVGESIAEYAHFQEYRKRVEGKEKEALDSAESYERSSTVKEGALLYEALLATDRGADADKISERLLAFDATGSSFVTLIRAADRAGAADRVKALGERALAALPEKEQAAVKKALARAAKPK